MAVEYLGAVGLVEPLNIGVLCGFAGLDVLQGNTLALRPLSQCMGDPLRSVVQSNRQRRAAHLHQLVQCPYDASSRQAGVDLNAQAFAVEFIDDIEGVLLPPEGTAALARGRIRA